MPEIMAHPVVERILIKNDIPHITLITDEHFGEEGFNTRIESFIDMIRLKKQRDLL
jgi:benzoyl-CoA reductase/2-hydroxyglutaryl-CoA dehydratase subunit BcrC/BadD/HgdB